MKRIVSLSLLLALVFSAYFVGHYEGSRSENLKWADRMQVLLEKLTVETDKMRQQIEQRQGRVEL